jgi:hypothetical protein
MAESEKPGGYEKPPKESRPPRLNGPAIFVFGFMGVVIGLSVDGLGVFIWIGVAIMLVGAYGIWALRRYEKAQAIEEELPGRGRYDSEGNPLDEDE